MKPPARVTREELFRQVWAKPMSSLAKDYGISGNGLAKICDRLVIPYPPRGWWAKKAAGKKVAYRRLPELSDDTPDRVTISPAPPRVVPDVEATRDLVKATIGDAAIRVAKTLHAPHPIVARWVAEQKRELDRARSEPRGSYGALIARITWSETKRRRVRVLDALFKEGEKRGLKVVDNGYVQHFLTSGEKLDFKLRETEKRIRRPKTESDLRWPSNSGRDWTWQQEPSGRLRFKIETHVPGLPKRKWTETPEESLEDLAGEILAALIAAGPLLVAARRAREEAERARMLEERRRYEAAEKKRKDDNRWRRFLEFAEQWAQIDVASRFLAEVEARVATLEEGEEKVAIASWLPWLRERLEQHNPLHAGAAGMFRTLSSVTSSTYPRSLTDMGWP